MVPELDIISLFVFRKHYIIYSYLLFVCLKDKDKGWKGWKDVKQLIQKVCVSMSALDYGW